MKGLLMCLSVGHSFLADSDPHSRYFPLAIIFASRKSMLEVSLSGERSPMFRRQTNYFFQMLLSQFYYRGLHSRFAVKQGKARPYRNLLNFSFLTSYFLCSFPKRRLFVSHIQHSAFYSNRLTPLLTY
jgi:hypothetical protein